MLIKLWNFTVIISVYTDGKRHLFSYHHFMDELCGRLGNSRRPHAVILDSGFPSNYSRIGYAYINQYVGERRLETREIIRDECVVPRDSSALAGHNQCGSGASSNPVVQDRITLSITRDHDPGAVSAEGCALGRGHSHVVVRDNGALL